MGSTKSALRQNVLDQFAEAGVEIMTPNVNAVRNSVEQLSAGGYPALHLTKKLFVNGPEG